ncbi:MAG: MoxR family ATPase [Ignavibacteria bacterium]|nr:MoxR family ATPase [Ignavibacteria bacterium]
MELQNEESQQVESTQADAPFHNRTDVTRLQNAAESIRTEIRKIVVGQKSMVDLLIAAVLADGHVLIEGVPGIAKTLTAKLLARTLDVGFQRIQFTPDLMPSDVLGTSVFNPKSVEFEFRQGPIFSHLILIDEINRAPAKTQAALFEVMEERQVTIDGTTYPMDRPFLVVATQNPIDQEGTYRLPEAQLDRFLFKIEVEYPTLEEESQILMEFHARKNFNDLSAIQPMISGADIAEFQAAVRSLHIDENLLNYIAQIVGNTRSHKGLFLGASPRASIGIMTAAKAFAAMNGRDFVTPEDIKDVAPHILRHRILLTPEKEMEGVTTADIVRQIIEKIEVPR